MSEERPKVSDHWMILRCGVEVWNRWRNTTPATRPDLRGVDLEGTDLKSTNLRGADLTGANLRRASLVGANLRDSGLGWARLRDAALRNAYFAGANLRRADLVGADLRRSDLRGADLVGADLRRANFREADLREADLRGTNLGYVGLGRANLQDAILGNTHFHGVDLREAEGLEEVRHSSPSLLGSQTLKESQGQIPQQFLKGCGLEDWEILAVRLHKSSLRPDQVMDIGYEVLQIRASSPIVPQSLFLSYSHEDQRLVEKLEARFDSDHIRCWRDVHDLKAGPIEAQVDRAIGLQRATLLVLSENSVESDWVVSEARKAREVEKARRKGGEGKYVLCPIALDDAWKTCGWPRRLREQIMEYNILDFSRWGSDEEFEKQYEKLKTGLGIYYADQGPES